MTLTMWETHIGCLMYFRLSNSKNPFLRGATFLSRALVLMDSFCQVVCPTSGCLYYRLKILPMTLAYP